MARGAGFDWGFCFPTTAAPAAPNQGQGCLQGTQKNSTAFPTGLISGKGMSLGIDLEAWHASTSPNWHSEMAAMGRGALA